LEDLIAVVPLVDDPYALSIYLNLTKRLDQENIGHSDLQAAASKILLSPGNVREYATKRAFLMKQLEVTAEIRRQSLLPDGLIALKVVVSELEVQKQRERHSTFPPIWGTYFGSDVYLLPDAR